VKKILVSLLFLLAFALPAFGQSAHSVTATWVASPDAVANPSITYNIYRATSTCPIVAPVVLAKIGSTAAGILTFPDTNVSVGNTYCYAVTAVLNGLESVDSQTAQAVILPAAPPSAPSLVVH
jgi:hypothetical protein